MKYEMIFLTGSVIVGFGPVRQLISKPDVQLNISGKQDDRLFAGGRGRGH